MSMARLERWLHRGLILGLLVLFAHAASAAPNLSNAGGGAQSVGARLDAAAAGQVAWPPSAGLLVSEVVTRGAAASDQYVEIYNASSGALDLAGLELTYVTASGLTVTRKQSWTSLLLPAHAHLLIANASGTYAGQADGLFSNGGFSTAGGSLVLRALTGGQVIDALSWGSATNSFVESAPGTAPPTGSSLERKPGGLLGNAIDTNDNLADSRLETSPVPQNLAAQPVPAPTSSSPPTAPPTASPGPTTSASPEPTGTLDPTTSPDPTPSPDPTATSQPSDTLEPTASPQPTQQPTPQPTPQPTAPPTPSPAPTPPPTSSPTVAPTPTATLAPLTVAAARALPLGTTVTIAAQLTTPTGLTESGAGAFAEDGTAGIALYLPSADWPLLTAGTRFVATGVLETRYSLLTLRLASAADITPTAVGEAPVPVGTLTGAVDESLESRLVTVTGTISDGISTLTDGFSTAVDDGSGSLRVLVASTTGIAADALSRGSSLQLFGVIGQRDTSGTGTSGYRLHLRSPADIVPLAEPSPPPSPTVGPTATPGPSPTGTVEPSPTPAPPTATPTPSATAAPITIETARGLTVGQAAAIEGIVTVEPGRILGDDVMALQDATGGICVQLPADALAGIGRGSAVIVAGILAAPYGNLELRPVSAADVRVVGAAALPVPRQIEAVQLGEATEGLLATVSGTLTRIESSSTSISLFIEDGSAESRVFIYAALGISTTEFTLGSQLEVTGIVGDRLGLYRLWPRDRADIRVVAVPTPTPAPSATPGASPSPSPTSGTTPAPTGPAAAQVVPIADALRRTGQKVAIEGVVTAPAGLLDSDNRRVTLQDATAAILVRLPADGPAPELGRRVLVVGEIGTYYGAPQLAATDPPVNLSGGGLPAPIVVRTARLESNLEWRLVTVTGNVTSVQRDGDAWRAEVEVGGAPMPINGLARSGIPSTALIVGRSATIIGIVKRPYPTATDQRFMLVPRMPSDIKLGAATKPGQSQSAPGSAARPLPVSGDGGAIGPGASGGSGSGGDTNVPAGGTRPFAIALADIAAHEGEMVTVGGRIEAVDGDRLLVNDGTSVAAVRLANPEIGAGRIRPGMLVNARGLIGRTDQGGLEVVVTDADGIRFLDPVLTAAQPGISSLAPGGTGSGSDTDAPAPAGTPLPLALAGLLVLAGMVGSAGVAISRRPQLLHALKLALANMRTRD
jgi:hypothetical protein